MADDSEQIGQDEIEELLRQAQGQSPAADASPTSPNPPALNQSEIEALLRSQGIDPAAVSKSAAASRKASGSSTANDMEFLLSHAEQALASLDEPADDMPAGIAPFQFKDLAASPPSADEATLELVREVQLELKIELGRTQMYLEDVLKLKKGAVVPLDKLAGDPVDIYVNGRLIARGEVLVLNDNFCVRVAELIVGHTSVA